MNNNEKLKKINKTQMIVGILLIISILIFVLNTLYGKKEYASVTGVKTNMLYNTFQPDDKQYEFKYNAYNKEYKIIIDVWGELESDTIEVYYNKYFPSDAYIKGFEREENNERNLNIKKIVVLLIVILILLSISRKILRKNKVKLMSDLQAKEDERISSLINKINKNSSQNPPNPQENNVRCINEEAMSNDEIISDKYIQNYKKKEIKKLNYGLDTKERNNKGKVKYTIKYSKNVNGETSSNEISGATDNFQYAQQEIKNFIDDNRD